MAAYRHDSGFWGRLVEKTTADGNKYPERYAEIEFRRQLGAVERESRRIYLYPGRSEFRLNAREIHEDADIGDLMMLELAPLGVAAEYVARVVKPTDPLYSYYDAIASSSVPSSDKRWGYA
jgi:hypothetical protein